MTNAGYAARYGEDWVFETAGRFSALVAQRGHHPVSLAVAWAAANPDVTAPIIGARDLTQLRPSLDALAIDMTPDFRAELSALGRTPPPATDRLDAPGVAMDRAEIIGDDVTLESPVGKFGHCLRVLETTPLEPGEKSYKMSMPRSCYLMP